MVALLGATTSDARLAELAANGAVNAITFDTRGAVLTLADGDLFAYGTARLERRAYDRLDRVADAVAADDRAILIEGHSRTVDLSMRRAQAVRDFLVARGVSSDRLSAAGLGFSARPHVDIVLLAPPPAPPPSPPAPSAAPSSSVQQSPSP